MEDCARINHYGGLMRKIVDFRTADKYCDVDIIVKERTFKCHRLILSAASKYFDRTFIAECKDSTEKVITLHEVEADIFEDVLRFVYEGDIEVINSSNVYGLIRAAESYGLPLLGEFCVEFVRENLNEIANDVLKIFSFAHDSAKENLVELLSRHINENFHYFSKAPEFYEFTIDKVEKVLDAIIDGRPPVLQDVFYDGICEWIRRRVNPSVDERESFDRLLRKVDSKYLSLQYAILGLPFVEKTTKTQVSRESGANYEASATGNKAENKLSDFLYAYISRRSSGRPPSNTSIFSLRNTLEAHLTFPFGEWVSSGELKHAYDFLRTIVIDDRLYFLGCFEEHENPQQTFTTGTSIPMYPYVSLKPPPLILNEFDMCGTGDHIYVYNKKNITNNNTIQTCGGSAFSVDELFHGMYMYKRDVDEWLSLPHPRIRFNDACMTCDEKLVYLIGGSNSKGFVQVYDVRTQGWFTLPSTAGTYDGAACCLADDKVYVAGGLINDKSFEMYDPVRGKWQQKAMLPETRFGRDNLFNWRVGPRAQRVIVSFSSRVSPHSNVLFYKPVAEKRESLPWVPVLPHVHDCLKYKNQTSNDKINVLDMFGF